MFSCKSYLSSIFRFSPFRALFAFYHEQHFANIKAIRQSESTRNLLRWNGAHTQNLLCKRDAEKKNNRNRLINLRLDGIE